jgi:hypothetical protein
MVVRADMSTARQGTLTPYDGEYAAGAIDSCSPSGNRIVHRWPAAESESDVWPMRSALTPGER